MNCIGIIVPPYLNSDTSISIEILEAYEATLEEEYYECCKNFAYKISLVEECGASEGVLEELHKKVTKILDKLTFKEQLASFLLMLNHFKEVKVTYQS